MGSNNQIVRILAVAQALAASRRGIALKALAERRGWPLRSVYRDVDALERAGFPIIREDGRYRLIDGWTAPALPGIEPDEILALYSVRAMAESWRATTLGRSLDRLWMKLTANGAGQAALMPVATEPWFGVRSPLSIDYRAHEKMLATFEKAIRERLAVNCRYRALSTRQVSARIVEPGELFWDPGLESLYVIGWCRLRQDVRVFAAHRFVMAALTEDRFVPRAEARSKAALRNAFRVWRSKSVETVRVRFAPEVADEIRERRWAAAQSLDERADGSVVLTLEVAGLNEVARWVLSYGGAAQVLEPRALAASVSVAHRKGLRRYGEKEALSLPRNDKRVL